MRQGKWCLHISLSHSKKYRLYAIPPMHYFNTQSVHCSLPHLYGNSLMSKSPEIPKPSEWGWEWNNRTMAWVPYWTDLPDASHGCLILLHCGCSVACNGNCKSFRAGIWCSQLCKCDWGWWTVNRMYHIVSKTVSSISHFSKSQKNQFL